VKPVSTKRKKRQGTKGEATRQRILDGALALFRKRGFEATTMRDVAADVGVALGAAYYYFPSKEALVLAYYARHQEEHAARVVELYAGTRDPRARLGGALHAKIELVRRERKLLGALFSRAIDMDSPLSVFSVETRAIREANIQLYADAFAEEPLPDDLRALVGPAFWTLQLGLLMYFIRDRSAKQERTHALIDRALDLTVPLVHLLGLPHLSTVRAQLNALIGEIAQHT
jgi:AcrR family transcriptional regulator